MTRAFPIAAPRPAPNPDLPLVVDGIVNRPSWHRNAACRDEDVSEWIIERGQGGHERLANCRAVCARCPVAGRCLAEGLAESAYERNVGPVRLGLSSRAWAHVRELVADLDVDSDADLDVVAAWIVDGLVRFGTKRGPTTLDDDVAA